MPTPRGDRLVDDLSLLDNALLLERRHRFEGADGAYHKLLAGAGTSGVYTASYGAFLERRGRRADAIALYQSALKADRPAGAIMKPAWPGSRPASPRRRRRPSPRAPPRRCSVPLWC